MKKFIHHGEWYVPGNTVRLSGRLLFKEKSKKIILEIFGDKYIDGAPVVNSSEGRDPRYHSTNYNDDFREVHPLINGKTMSVITLYNSRWSGTEEIGIDLYLIKYEVQFAFFGTHISLTTDLLVSSAILIFPYLSTWFDGPESLDKLKEIEHKKFSQYGYSNNRNEVTPIPVKGDLQLAIFDDYSKGREIWGVNHSIKFQKKIDFIYKVPVAFSQFLHDVGNFRGLLEFCHGRPVNQKLLNIYFDKPCQVGNYTLHGTDNVEKHSRHQNYMLLSRWIMERQDLESVIKKWFANISYNSMYDIYSDSNNWFQNTGAILSNVMFNNRFLNIVQALESWCKKNTIVKVMDKGKAEEQKKEFEKNKKAVLALIKDSKQKEWCNANLNYQVEEKRRSGLEKMLAGLIASNEHILTPIFGKSQIIDFFPGFASRIRNNLSHGLQEKTSQGEVLSIFFQVGQILLAICILKTLEVKNIKQKIEHFDDFQRSIYQVKLTKLKFV